MAATQSKERILAGAKALFLARGYAATTVDAICEKAELTKGSFYYFFDSKEDLGLAVLDWSLRRSVLLRFLSIWRNALQSFGAQDACWVPSRWELADTNSRMQQVVASMFQALDFAEKLQPIADHPARIPKAIRGFRLSLATLIAEPA